MERQIEQIVEPLYHIDWDDFNAISANTRQVLQELADNPLIILRAAREVQANEHLFALCEHYDILDKVVLYDGPRFRVRLHVFASGYFDRPHEHRWSYSSVVLSGGYMHTVFMRPEQLDKSFSVKRLEPLMMRWEGVGSIYTLHPMSIHAVSPDPGTVSLIVRGPAIKDRFLVIDRDKQEAWWQYGSGDESAEERAEKLMSTSRLEDVLRDVEARLGSGSLEMNL